MPLVPPRITTFNGIGYHQTGEPIARCGCALRDPTSGAPPGSVEARLHRAEVLRPGERVLREIDASALGDDLLVHAIDKRLGVVAHRQVERDRDALLRERQQPFALGAAVLDHAEERRAAAAA